ncbi:EAL domain-containing protein [Ectothiorhodospira shaposhnikovii]|uniref:EAL domain-containing protein n=1 Tax=Ectothiorhodospira shaposhnikovii TaxID=1054 RepID=UPI0019033CAB|nr:EAL domain-containing protein [Ectothiorhodospira shaposhnikovii]
MTSLSYALEPVVGIRSGSQWPILGMELLYRGNGTPPDGVLLEWLGQHRLTTHELHLNLDTPTILLITDRIICAAARRHHLVIEWTEKPWMDRRTQYEAGRRLAEWRVNHGLRIALDDLGDGMDGLGRLSAIPGGADMVKVAGPLFHLTRDCPDALRVLQGLRHCLPSRTLLVMEWIETRQDLATARGLASAGQGRLFPAFRRDLPLTMDRSGGRPCPGI